MKKYEIWCEGYKATGQQSSAQLLSTVESESFAEACIEYFGSDKLFNKEMLTYWGCRLCDNESDARRNFG